MENLLSKLSNAFKIRDLREPGFFLGIETVKCVDGLILSQRKYMNDILKRVGMTNCKPLATPLSVLRSSSISTDLYDDPTRYRSLAGAPNIPVPKLWCDNLCATYMCVNPNFHARTKYVEIDYHFVRDKVASGDIQVNFISTKDQLADIFTKPLTGPRFAFLRNKLQVIDIPFA
ncbi:uncharacterized protein LOC116033196 [Ipomoea triloba]|uniref:uncharacterized protein LOC116033196 n=1 Tax=Ipomoea triloba TaxID=35885 RepID=UPI00125D682D|nr:uncharacterized protein LOC116033196 [Ipomoea triloba]